jgi:tRNA (cytidine/uridine-2'-O-)-methyltransferase
MSIRIALYQPDIPGNTGTILRMAACFDLEVHVIEPAGFDLSDRTLKRSGMDYLEKASLHRHLNWDAFEADCSAHDRRLVLFSTSSRTSYVTFNFGRNDVLLFGRESSGVPAQVHERANARLVIPMRPDRRSLNLALSVAMATGEALRQLGALEGA